LVQVEQEVRDAGPFRDIGIATGQQHAEVSEMRPGGPHLLSRDQPPIAVALGARRQ
jgi:hypothetical protein